MSDQPHNTRSPLDEVWGLGVFAVVVIALLFMVCSSSWTAAIIVAGLALLIASIAVPHLFGPSPTAVLPQVALLIIPTLSVIGALAVMTSFTRRWRREYAIEIFALPRCRGCWYALEGLPTTGGMVTCPECGRENPQGETTSSNQLHETVDETNAASTRKF